MPQTRFEMVFLFTEGMVKGEGAGEEIPGAVVPRHNVEAAGAICPKYCTLFFVVFLFQPVSTRVHPPLLLPPPPYFGQSSPPPTPEID